MQTTHKSPVRLSFAQGFGLSVQRLYFLYGIHFSGKASCMHELKGEASILIRRSDFALPREASTSTASFG
jgi:hypothetical protein